MLEIFLIIAVLFAVFVLFYRQAIEQYDILQIEGTQIADLPKLLSERSPLVVRDVGQPKLFIPDTLKANTRLLGFPIEQNVNLGSYLQNPSVAAPYKMTYAATAMLAKETGLDVWGQHTWFPKVFSNSLWENIYSFESEAHVGEMGLRKTTAIFSILYPTSGALEVTLLVEAQGKLLPKQWRGRFPEKLTIQDTPLAGEIKYITIKLRPGNILFVPTHWFLSIRAAESDKDKPILWSWFEIHNPISKLSTRLERSMTT